MNWSNVRLILVREIRDQLRDRRTMFMIFIVPILTYPFLGMIGLQMSQFVQQKTTRILVLGSERLPKEPVLLEENRFAQRLFRQPGKTRLLELSLSDEAAPPRRSLEKEAREAIDAGTYDAVLFIPPDFGKRVEAYRDAVRQGNKPPQVPKPEIVYTSAVEKSQLAGDRLRLVLERWADEVAKSFLAAAGVPEWSMQAVDLDTVDLAKETGYRGAAVWSKVLPVLLILWALVGAFYPAVDLCAGEKERGTLETLLSSPAARSEIVLGKLVTIMLFSSVTAVLNLLSVAATGPMMFSHLPGFGPPPALSPLWLGLALIPASALFSALCLSMAAFARSTKEGQYYLMPLMALTIPLAILPAAAGLEMNLGTSLIPVAGLVLWLRSALEGNYLQALQFAGPVLATTLAGCLLAIRWAVEQFNSESVLFRESERLDLRLWLHHLVEDRGPTPTAAEAVFCGVVILVVHFFLSLKASPQADFTGFAVQAAVTQLTVVLTPALLMTVVLTASPRQTLLLRWPRWFVLPAAALLAVAVHPAVNLLQVAVMRLYPLSEEMQQALGGLEAVFQEPPWWQVVLVVALLPAVCEELAFRGFIFSGLRKSGSPWRAIVVSAVFFGLSHGILQQSMIAGLIGVLLGWLAFQTGSILPGMVFHLVHNAMGVLTARVPNSLPADWPIVAYFFHPSNESGPAFPWPVVLASSLIAVLLLVWLARQSGRADQTQ